MSRAEWERRQQIFYDQRYCRLGRNTDFPFPGCSDIVIPTTDEAIDKVKAAEVSRFMNVRPMCTFMPVQDANIDVSRKLEWYMDWRIRYSIPDFFRQLILGIDDRLQKGRAIFKVIWEYETETVYQTVCLGKLPGRLKQFSVIPKGVKNAAAAAEFIAQRSGGESVPITKEEFDKQRKAIEQIVTDEFDLDTDDPMDRKALSELMEFFRSGDNEVVIKKREVKAKYPRMVAVDPMDIIVPHWTKDPEKSERITHRMWLTKDQLRKKVRDQRWSEDAVEELLNSGSKNEGSVTGQLNMYSVAKANREGVNTYSEDTLYEIHENYCYYDIDNDGCGEKVVLITSPGIESPIKFIAYPYDHGEWPFTFIPYELNDYDYYSPRGIPEKVQDLDEEITQQHRAKLNRMTIANSPTFTYRRGSGFNPSKVQWIPGQMYQVTQQGDVQAIQIPNLDISFDREQSILRAQVESYVGSPDLAITSPLSQSADNRTATEVNAITAQSQQSVGYRAALFQTGMARVMNQMWALEGQYNDDDLFIKVADEAPLKLTRKEIQGKFVVVPRGTVLDSSPEVKAGRMLQEFQILMQAMPILMQDPRYDINPAQRLLDYYQTLEPLDSKRFIRKRTPQELQQIQQQMQQQQAGQKAMESNQPMPLGDIIGQLKQVSSKAPHGANQEVSF